MSDGSPQLPALASRSAAAPPRAGGWSLRTRLLVLLLAAAFVAWALAAAWLVQRAQQTTDRLFDSALAETAHLVLALAVHEADEGEGHGLAPLPPGGAHVPDGELALLPPVRAAHDERTFFQVRDGRGRIALVSPGGPTLPLADAGERGYADHRINDAPWRVFSIHDPRTRLTVHVGEPMSARMQFAAQALWQLAAPGLALLLALAAVTIAITQRLLAPVAQAARRIAAAAPGESVAVDAAALPREIAPLLAAIDALQARVQQALLHERTLTADAAHELRTPLAALRAQAQLAQMAQRAGDTAGRDAALAAVIAAADRCARLADSTLTLARLDAATLDPAALPVVDLAQIAALVEHDVARAAETRGITLSIDVPADVRLRGDADALAILLRNLLDNAIRHAHTRVELAAAREGDTLRLSVRDDGPGVPAADRARLFDRFWRGDPGHGDSRPAHNGQGGSGLGLALVQRIAQLHGARITVGEGLSGPKGPGFAVAVQFPARDH